MYDNCLDVWNGVMTYMVLIGKSKGICGSCGTPFSIEWDPDIVNSNEKNSGIESEYKSEEELICQTCGNHIRARLHFYEYPEGMLCRADADAFGDKDIVLGKSKIEKPTIEFFDL